jgi:hypothetical protein
MLRFEIPFGKSVPIFLAIVGCCSVASLGQDSSRDLSAGRVVPAPVEPAPFSATLLRTNPTYGVEFQTADELPPRDRLLLANSESSIAELARSRGLEYGASGWNYRKIGCPGFTNHLFVQFTQNNGNGDVSVFSASIPRNGVGRIRIVPILKRSYSLFSPAPINSMTISAFNHIRSEEGQTANDDWLGNALCYAALAGAHPKIFTAGSWPGEQDSAPTLTAALDIQFNEKGRELISFDDVGAYPHAMEWTMLFTRDGKLIKATHKPAGILHGQPVPSKSPVVKSWQIPKNGGN